MTDAQNARIGEILRMLRLVRRELQEGTACERIKVIEKALLQLDAELEERSRDPGTPS
jgi:hypothetical protein